MTHYIIGRAQNKPMNAVKLTSGPFSNTFAPRKLPLRPQAMVDKNPLACMSDDMSSLTIWFRLLSFRLYESQIPRMRTGLLRL